MQTSRFLLAAQSGEIDVPSESVGWLNATADGDLGIDAAMIHAAQPFFPDHERLRLRGLNVSPVFETDVECAVVNAHRSKAATFELIAQAAMHTAIGGLVPLTATRLMELKASSRNSSAVFEGVESYSKAHGKLVWFIPAVNASGPQRLVGHYLPVSKWLDDPRRCLLCGWP